MRYLLDTNILANVIKAAPSDALLTWMGEQADTDLFIASLTVAEIRRGILETPAGRKRDRLEAWFSGPEGPQALFAGRILAFDERAGLIWARLMTAGKARGRPRAAGSTPSSPPSPRPMAASSSPTTNGTSTGSRRSIRCERVDRSGAPART